MTRTRFRRINFGHVASEAARHSEAILARWLPGGIIVGREYKARNPKRNDGRIGSFSINLNTGKYADFATGDKGKDLISLAAWLFDISQRDAAIKTAEMLGVDAFDS